MICKKIFAVLLSFFVLCGFFMVQNVYATPADVSVADIIQFHSEGKIKIRSIKFIFGSKNHREDFKSCLNGGNLTAAFINFYAIKKASYDAAKSRAEIVIGIPSDTAITPCCKVNLRGRNKNDLTNCMGILSKMKDLSTPGSKLMFAETANDSVVQHTL